MAIEARYMVREAFGDLSLSRSRVFRLFKEYKGGRDGIEDDRRKFADPSLRSVDNLDKISALTALSNDHSGFGK